MLQPHIFTKIDRFMPRVQLIHYDPDQPLHGRYVPNKAVLEGEEAERARAITRVINAFFRWDFNSCELLRADGVLHPIDFANACPDSQVNSIHYYFPELVINLLSWSLYCATVRRRPALGLDWDRFFAIADQVGDFDAKLPQYDALARAYFDEEGFEHFCEQHLSSLHAVAHDYFGSARFREVVHAKVASVFPAHEVEVFTNHFFGLVQQWRADHPLES